MNRATPRAGDVNPASSAGEKSQAIKIPLRNRPIYALQTCIEDKTSIYHSSFRAKSRFLNFSPPPAFPPSSRPGKKTNLRHFPPFFQMLWGAGWLNNKGHIYYPKNFSKKSSYITSKKNPVICPQHLGNQFAPPDLLARYFSRGGGGAEKAARDACGTSTITRTSHFPG